jgi:hypothetical protein
VSSTSDQHAWERKLADVEEGIDYTTGSVNVQSLLDHNKPGSDPRLFRVVNRYVGNSRRCPASFRTIPRQ